MAQQVHNSLFMHIYKIISDLCERILTKIFQCFFYIFPFQDIQYILVDNRKFISVLIPGSTQDHLNIGKFLSFLIQYDIQSFRKPLGISLILFFFSFQTAFPVFGICCQQSEHITVIIDKHKFIGKQSEPKRTCCIQKRTDRTQERIHITIPERRPFSCKIVPDFLHKCDGHFLFCGYRFSTVNTQILCFCMICHKVFSEWF